MNKLVTLYQNQWDIKYHFDKLNDNFDFYRIINTFDDKNFAMLSSKIQFSLSQVLNVKVGRKQTYIVIRKSEFGEKDFRKLEAHFDPIKINIDKVQSQDICHKSDIGGVVEKNYYHLTCLILGLLPKLSKRDGLAQIDGNVYFFMPKKEKKWHKKDRTIGITIEPDYHDQRFHIKARTFAKLNDFNREKTTQFFTWDNTKGVLQQISTVSRNSEIEYYSNKAIPKARAAIPQLDLRSVDDYQKTKMGILEYFMQELQRYLGKYISVQMKTMDNIDFQSAKYAHIDHKNDYIGHFSDQTIYLIDLIKSEESKNFINNFQHSVNSTSSLEKINFEISDKPLEGYNLALLHNLEYYESSEAVERGEKDPHLVMMDGQIIQHITIEDFEYSSADGVIEKDPMNKVFQELILKEANSKLQLNNLTMLNYFNTHGSLSFAMYAKENDERVGLYIQEINSDGKINYRYFSPENISQTTDPLLTTLEKMRLSRKDKHSKYENYNKVAGFVIKNSNAIAMIYETNMSTISDFEYIREILEDTKSDSDTIIIENLKRVVQQFLLNNENHLKFQKGQEFYESLEKYGYTEQVGIIKKGFSLQGKPSIFKELNDEIHEQLGYYIWPPIRTIEYEQAYANLLHINCFIEKGKNYYFVGIPKKGIKNAPIVRTTKIRELVLNRKDALRFGEIRDLFDIDLVKNGTMTVYPFPFKLLREYIDNEQRKIQKLTNVL